MPQSHRQRHVRSRATEAGSSPCLESPAQETTVSLPNRRPTKASNRRGLDASSRRRQPHDAMRPLRRLLPSTVVCPPQSQAHTHRLWRDLEFSARATTRRRANRWPTRFSHLVCVILQFLHELVSRGELAISQESGLIMVWPRSEDKSKKGSFLSFPHHFLLRCGTPHTHTQNFFHRDDIGRRA